jgi:dihydrodipicolinate synthase/N-acetylneuraminate lyase
MNGIDTLRGAVAVTVTPVTERSEPDYQELRRQTDWLCGKNITALFPCSSTGEFVRFQTREKIDILKTVADANRGRKRLIAGACGTHLHEVLQYLEAAAEYGYDACVVCPPYYYPQKQEDTVKFYLQAAEKAKGMKIILYNVPFFTTGLELDTIDRLMKVDGIVGIKDSSANMKGISHINSIKTKDFLVYTGTDDCLLPALTAGCDGSMTALAGILPEWISSVYTALERGDLAQAGEIQRSVHRLLRIADFLPFPMGYKLLAEARGLKIGPQLQFIPVDKTAAIQVQIKKEIQNLIQGGYIDESNGLEGL